MRPAGAVPGTVEAYPEYRESGLPWLGRIPAHWDVRRNGRLFAQRRETGYPELPILEVSLRTGVRVRDMDAGGRKQMMADLAGYQRAVKGDIAYNMMRLWQGAVGVAPEDGLISPAYVVATPYPETDSRYFAYLFRTKAYMEEVNKYSRGIVADRNRLYWDDFKRMPSVYPPLEEQRAIVAYLDAVGWQVQQFIRWKLRLIDLLTEQKQAIVHRAVTRGLDPSVRLKDSGVAWLGEMPEHWRVVRLRQVALFNPSKSESFGYKERDELVTFLPMESVSTDGQIDGRERVPASSVWNGYTYFQRGDVVVAKITPCFENGKGAYLGDLPTDIGFGTTEFIVLRAQQVDPAYLYLLTASKAFRVSGVDEMTGAAGQQRIPMDFVRNFQVGLPPRNEQSAILTYVREESGRIDRAIDRARQEIALIQEYRSRLITDAVTGEVDLRHVDLRVWDLQNISDDQLNSDDLTANQEQEEDVAWDQ